MNVGEQGMLMRSDRSVKSGSLFHSRHFVLGVLACADTQKGMVRKDG